MVSFGLSDQCQQGLFTLLCGLWTPKCVSGEAKQISREGCEGNWPHQNIDKRIDEINEHIYCVFIFELRHVISNNVVF